MKPLSPRRIIGSLVLLLALLAPATAQAGEGATDPTPTPTATLTPVPTHTTLPDGQDPGQPGTSTAPTVVVTETVTVEVPVEVPGTDGGDPGFGSGGPGDDGLVTEPQPGTSVPRIMLTEFITDPGQVVAGDAVTASFTLQNMSRTTRVNNLRVTLTADDAGAFLPVNGSSSMFISSIRAEHSVSRQLALRTLPGLEERPYSLTLKIEYEDALANAYESTEQVAIPVTQVGRADTSSPQVMPAEVMVGQQASVTFSINNLGKSKLFNARAVIPEGQPVAEQEVFVGTIEPGASGAVDMTLVTQGESADPVVLEISYEDAQGTVTTLERTIELMIFPEMVPEEEWPMEEEWPEDGDPGAAGLSTGTIVALAAAVLLALAVIIWLISRSRSRRRDREKDSDMALLDGDPLVPTDAV